MKATGKRTLVLFIALCMMLQLLPIGVSAAAADTSRDLTFELAMAEDLKALGLFQGVGTNADGSTDFDLDRAPTRLEALVMLVRLLGQEEAANSGNWSHPFTDVPAWADKVVGYAYAQGLTKGSSETEFGTGTVSAAMYCTFVLRALGYDDGAGDFAWNDNEALSRQIGILPVGVDLENFWRGDVVAVSYAALYAKVKDGSQTLSEKLISQGVFTDAAFQDAADERLLLAHTIPELRLKGNWPVSEEFLQQKWAEIYPYYVRCLGLPTKILTEGITWEWDDSIREDTVGWYPETNSFMMGPLEQHDNLNPENHYDYEPLVMQCMHETAHLFWQEGSDWLKFDFGQWAWEAAALVAESVYYAEKYGTYNQNTHQCYDLRNLCGWEAMNGVYSDSKKFDRSIEDGAGTTAFVYLSSVLSDAGTWNYFQKVNDLRVRQYRRTGKTSISFEEYLAMLDEAAGSRTIDGQAPSEWLKTQPVSNQDGALGDYLMAFPLRLFDDYSTVELACFRRFTDEHNDKKEEAYANQTVSIEVFDLQGSLVGSALAVTGEDGKATADLANLSGLENNTALRFVATTVVGGKTLTAVNYLIYSTERLDGTTTEKTALLLLDESGNVAGSLTAADIEISGAYDVDTSAVSRGLVIVSAKTGAELNIRIGSKTFIRSQPGGMRVVPLTVG